MVVGARMAVDCFVLITGYFCIYNQKPMYNKLARLWVHRLLFSVVISIIFIILGLRKLTIWYSINALFPVITNRHNFITVFFILYFFIPFINKLLLSLSKKEFLIYLFIYITVISFLPTFLNWTKKVPDDTYSYLAWMVLVYCIGAYIRLYGLPLCEKKYFYALAGCAMYCFLIFMTLVVEPRISWLPKYYTALMVNSFFALITAVFLFYFFLNLKLTNKPINTIAESTFTVLLIESDPLVRSVLYTKIFKCAQFGTSPYLGLHIIITVITIYTFCILVDKLVKVLFLNWIWKKIPPLN